MEEYPPIGSHGEPQVVGVYTDSFLAIIHHIDIFLICDSSNFSENFEVVMDRDRDRDPTTTVDRHVDEHLTS